MIDQLTADDGSTAETVFGLGAGIVILLVIVGGAVLFIAALVSVLRSANYTTAGKAIWILAVLAFPFLGAFVWFVWGRRSTFSV